MNGPLFSLRDVTLPASGGRQSPDCASDAVAKHNQGTDVPRSLGARLNSIMLEIQAGTTAVVGLSGAGKSSLLNVLAGFETQFSGELKTHFQGDAGNCLPLFWVPQSGGLWPHMSAEQHLDVVCGEVPQNAKSQTESRRFSKRTDELLSLFDLNHRRQAFPAELSQGERSRLALSRALGSRAKVLLLDEPLSHVDPVRKPAYWKIVRQVVAEENISMVFTCHEPETVLRHASHLICLEAGAVAYDGPVRTLYDNPPNAEIGEFLGPLNWFTIHEAATLLADCADLADPAIRPERLQIQISADSPIEFVSQSFAGLYAESMVRHRIYGVAKSVLHQVSHRAPRPGDSVTICVLPRSGANSR